VKPPPFEYHAPATLDEALRLRAELGPEASLLAGGQSLVPMLNMRLARPSALIDLNGIPELAYVRRENGSVAVGAMTRQRELERSEEAEQACPLLREALLQVAHAIVALGGTVRATGPDGVREIPAEELFEFHFTTSLAPDEILTEVRFPVLAREAGSAFLEVSRRHGDYALAGAACVVRGDDVRLAFTGVGPRPVLFEGDDPDGAAAAVEPATDIHGTADYRRELVRTLTRRAVELARRRARGGER
jgi:carbon-monoxide dehydrogenase medium subunit